MNYDYVVWFDADVMVMNHKIDVFFYVDQDANLTISEDINFERIKEFNKRVNTGVMIWEGKVVTQKKSLMKFIIVIIFIQKTPLNFFS